MGLKDLFGRKKSQAEIEAEKKISTNEVQKKVSGTRSRLEQLKSVMKSINFEVISKTVPEDRISTSDFARYRRNFDIMLGRLEKESAIELTRIDTSEVDSVMLYLVEHFDKALKTGNKETADRFIDGLRYGVVNGHAEIKISDMDHSEEIMQRRLSRLEQYKTIGKLSMHVDTLEKDIKLKRKTYDDYKHKYEGLFEELQKEMAMKPMVVEKIKRLGESNINASDPEAYEIVSKMGRVTNLYKTLNELKQNISILGNDINASQDAITQATTSLTDSDSLVDDMTVEALKKYNDEHISRVRKIEEESRRLDELSQRLFESMDQVFSDPKVIDSMVGKSIAFDQMMYDIEQKEIEREAGRKMLQELEQKKLEQEQEQEQQLLINE